MYSCFLDFTDDVNNCRPVNFIGDSVKLQIDFNRFYSCCEKNGLHVDALKCSRISFTHSRSYDDFLYNIANVELNIIYLL